MVKVEATKLSSFLEEYHLATCARKVDQNMNKIEQNCINNLKENMNKIALTIAWWISDQSNT